MKQVAAFLLLTLLIRCTAKDSFVPDGDGSYVASLQLNDSVIKRTRLDKNRKLSSVEYENTTTHIISIYYYDDKGKLYQSVRFNTLNSQRIQNDVFDDKGQLAERILKNKDNEKLSDESFDSDGKTIKKYFYREGNLAVNSFISFDKQGKPDLSYHKSHFLNLTRFGNTLYIQPVGLQQKQFDEASIRVLDVNQKNQNGVFAEQQRFEFESDSVLRFDLKQLKRSEKVFLEVDVLIGEIDGFPTYAVYELYLKNMDSIPKNNLCPILKDW